MNRARGRTRPGVVHSVHTSDSTAVAGARTPPTAVLSPAAAARRRVQRSPAVSAPPAASASPAVPAPGAAWRSRAASARCRVSRSPGAPGPVGAWPWPGVRPRSGVSGWWPARSRSSAWPWSRAWGAWAASGVAAASGAWAASTAWTASAASVVWAFAARSAVAPRAPSDHARRSAGRCRAARSAARDSGRSRPAGDGQIPAIRSPGQGDRGVRAEVVDQGRQVVAATGPVGALAEHREAGVPSSLWRLCARGPGCRRLRWWGRRPAWRSAMMLRMRSSMRMTRLVARRSL